MADANIQKARRQLEDDLRARQWPKRREKDVLGKSYAHVRYGRVETRTLSPVQDVGPEIPAGECAITSLCVGSSGRIYGATSGKRCHLFFYDPRPGADGVIDLGVIEGATAIRRCLVAHRDGEIFGAVSACGGKGDGRLFVHHSGTRKSDTTDYDSMGAYHGMGGPNEFLCAPLAGECVAALAICREREILYGLTSITGTFFVYDIKKKSVSLKGPVAVDGRFSSMLVTDGNGCAYGAGSASEIFRYDPNEDRLCNLDLFLPTLAGRQYYNKWDSAALDPSTGLIYGGGSADGVIFAFDPRALSVRSLGKASAEPRVRAMTMGLDGRVYGIAGEENGVGRLFYYDTANHALEDLGILVSSVQRVWTGYEFDAACTGCWGEIYFGESDRISHLFIYQPPIPSRTPSL